MARMKHGDTEPRRSIHIFYSPCLCVSVFIFFLSGARAAEPVSLRVDEFRSDASVRIVTVDGKTIVGTLKREIERMITADTAFELGTTAILALGGNIRDLTIDNLRVDPVTGPLQKIARIRVDWTVIDETTGKELIRKKNLLKELEYYTDTYSLELGLTEREALEEKLLIDLAKAILEELRKEEKNLPRTPEGKKIELTPEEKEELDKIGAVPEEKRKILSWNLDFQDEAIHIPKGTLAASGQKKKTTNRFIQTTTVKLEPWKVGKEGEIKGVTIGKYEPAEIREVTLQRGELEYQINVNNLLKLGTVSGSLNKYVFDQTVAGFFFDRNMKFLGMDHNFQAIGGREFRPTGIGDLPRDNIGAAWKTTYGAAKNETKWIVDLTRDNEATVTSGVRTQVENRIYGSSGKFTVPKVGTVLEYNWLRSEHKEDRGRDTSYLPGDLYEVKASHKWMDVSMKADYYFADEKFRTIFGSATTDKRKMTLTADLPGQRGTLEYKFNTEWTRTSKVTVRNLVETLWLGGTNMTWTPFKDGKLELAKNLQFPGEASLRRTYDDVKFTGTPQGKNLENFRFLGGAKTKYKDLYTVNASYSQDRERDRLKNTLFISEEFKWENTLTKRLFDLIDASAKGNYRTKDAGGVQDRFVTAGATLGYKKDDFSAQFDYLRDVKRGTVKSQDTTKDRFTLDLATSFENGPFKNTLSVRGDYEKNFFDNAGQNHDRFTTNVNLKVAF